MAQFARTRLPKPLLWDAPGLTAGRLPRARFDAVLRFVPAGLTSSVSLLNLNCSCGATCECGKECGCGATAKTPEQWLKEEEVKAAAAKA